LQNVKALATFVQEYSAESAMPRSEEEGALRQLFRARAPRHM